MLLNRVTEAALKRDRLIILGSTGVIVLVAWLYLVTMAAGMQAMDSSMAMMGQIQAWTGPEALLTFVMWMVMMVAMMTPSATPVILLYARVARRHNLAQLAFAPTGAFFLGYITIWMLFSAAATLLQWGLEQAALLSQATSSAGPVLGGVLLIGAGIYQWLPSKNVCLTHCRSPVDYLSTHWQSGSQGAFRMGLGHGAYCVGCCWAIMLLLFAGGVMNLLWVAAIAIFVLVEKTLPFGRIAGRVGAFLFVAAGVASISMSIQF
jgi:predicted metal-binding membrane protein